MINSTNTAAIETIIVELDAEKDFDLNTLTPELLSMVGGGDGMVNI